MLKKLVLLFVLAVLLLGGAAGLYAYRLYQATAEPFQGYPPDTPQFVEISAGMGPQAIGQRLVEAGVVRDPLVYRVAIWRSGNAPGGDEANARFLARFRDRVRWL